MPAYIINDMEVTDPALLEEYKKLSTATVAKFGGKFLARGGALGVLEGDWQPKRLVILEFPGREQAEAWANSTEYAPAKQLRQRAARSNVVVVEGAAAPQPHDGMPSMNSEKTYTKRLGILRKRADMTHAQFVAHWMGTHAELCKKLPGLRRYSVNLVDRERFPKFGYDGFSELWFDSEEALHAAFASAEGKVLLADLPNFTSQIDPLISVETQKLWP